MMSVRSWAAGICLVALALAGVAEAANKRAARNQIEFSMLVKGRVIIEPDGQVASWTLDERDKLPPEVSSLVDRVVPRWRFAPVVMGGEPVRGDARMSLRLLARRASPDSSEFQITIEDGHFGRDALSHDELGAKGLASEQVSRRTMDPPVYPRWALEMGAQGTVYLALLIDRQGDVQQAMVEQVNLRTIGDSKQLERMRRLLSEAALEAARSWTFQPPAAGEWVDDPAWPLRVPVSFFIAGSPGVPEYGAWDAYLPGPRQRVPWFEGLHDFTGPPDTLRAGEVYQAGSGVQLLTPIGGG